MLGRQIAACDPAICNNDIPEFNVAGAGKIVRRARVDCYGNFSNLAFYTYIDNRPVPQCPAGRPTRIALSKVYNFTGILYDEINNNGGYWIQEYEWSYSSSTPHYFTGTVYKRPGTNTIICNSFAAGVMRYSYAASYFKIEYTVGVDSYVPWGSTFDDCCSSVETQIDAVVRNPTVWSSTTGSTFGAVGIPTTISFYYKPIATANKDGLVIQLKSAALASGPWKVSTTSGSIVIENNSGTQYTFSGTLSAAASAISATAGSTLFTASVPSGVLGSVALVSDLKPIDFAQISTATCNIGLPIILAGEPVPPSNISTSHFLYTFSPGTCASLQAANLSYASAVLEGLEDTHDAYESWLRTPRYPKFPEGFADTGYYINDPAMPTIQLFFGCASGVGPGTIYNILNYWSLTSGDSLREYESSTDGGNLQEVLNWELVCSECITSGLTGCTFSQFKTTTGCGYPPPNPLTGAGGFFDCSPGQVGWYGWNGNLSTTNVPVETLGTSMKLSGVWSFE
jgi:hypothetical protein